MIIFTVAILFVVFLDPRNAISQSETCVMPSREYINSGAFPSSSSNNSSDLDSDGFENLYVSIEQANLMLD